jgi:ribosomal-protein-alanine N-acetyltransferase
MLNPPPLRFELLAEHHLPAIMEIEAAVNRSGWSEQSFRNEMAHGHGRFFVAFLKDEIVGYVALWLIVDEAHITTIAIAPAYRRQGLGRRLLAHALGVAVEAGMVCATLEVRAGNEPAIKLYEAAGFKSAAIRKRYYPDNREDAVVMWLHDLPLWEPNA